MVDESFQLKGETMKRWMTLFTAGMPELASQLKKELKAWQKNVNAPLPTTPNPECILK